MANRFFHIAYAPEYALHLPEGHRFPMLKYELIPGQLLYEGVITEDNLVVPGICSDEIVLQTHQPAYVQKLKNLELSAREQREIGFPQSAELIRREFMITQGTIDCCLSAFENGVALNVAGGTHHAFADRGEGFCLLNDFAVAAKYLLSERLARKILVIDLDVHQGNGTASIFRNNPLVFTFSMHGAHNYPFRKEQSDWDIGLTDGTSDQEYLSQLQSALDRLIPEQKPDFAFYLSGVDILETDKYGKLKITMQGCRMRDEMVFNKLRGANIPCAVSMGGGYSADVKIITEAHCNTFKAAKEIFDCH
ncbi:MAG: histone deacetylase [Ferruginibacter sp.]